MLLLRPVISLLASFMAITESPRPSRIFPGKSASKFSLFCKLPVEIRVTVYQYAASEPRILRLDDGIDTPPLLHTCSESRTEAKKHYTMHQGTIYCNERVHDCKGTPIAPYRIWINKNGQDILHVTPLERPLFAATQVAVLDPFDQAKRWRPSFALNNILAMDALGWVWPDDGEPFQNLRKILLETGKHQGGLPMCPDESERAWQFQTCAWEVLYDMFAHTGRFPENENLKNLGIEHPEMLIVRRKKMFDASRIDVNTLDVMAELQMVPNESYSCHSPWLMAKWRCVIRLHEEGRILYRKERDAMLHLQNAANEIALDDGILHPDYEPEWPSVQFLRQGNRF